MVRSGSRLCARHCAEQAAPRHLDAVGTMRPCASTPSCHPRVGLVSFSLGFQLPGGGGGMSGFEITRRILTVCRTFCNHKWALVEGGGVMSPAGS